MNFDKKGKADDKKMNNKIKAETEHTETEKLLHNTGLASWRGRSSSCWTFFYKPCLSLAAVQCLGRISKLLRSIFCSVFCIAAQR